MIYKVCHAFFAASDGKGLLSPSHKLLSMVPPVEFLQRSKMLQRALVESHTFLKNRINSSTHHRNLISCWPDIIVVCNTCKFGIGGIIIGKNETISPTVFCVKYPKELQDDLVSDNSPVRFRMCHPPPPFVSD